MVRKAQYQDADEINRILHQVNDVHAEGRPDIFKKGGVKYDLRETEELIQDPGKVVFVCTDGADGQEGLNRPDEAEAILGYLIGWFEENPEETSRRHRKTLYIDDICVDEKARRKHVGEQLYRQAERIAEENECDSITLNVWECNSSAYQFYLKMGLLPLKTTMEKCL